MSHIDSHPGADTYHCRTCDVSLGGDNVTEALVRVWYALHGGHDTTHTTEAQHGR